MSGQNRRAFLSLGLAAVRERAAGSQLGALPMPTKAPSPRRLQPRPTLGSFTRNDVLEAAAENGLSARIADLDRLLRPTVVVDESLPGPASVLTDFTVLAEVAVGELAADALGVPRSGTWLFAIDDRVPVDTSTLAGARAGRVRFVERTSRKPRADAPLSLPRVWSAAVQRLSLDPAEQDAWETTRTWLATSQGLPGDMDPMEPCNRFLGYPDERRGKMASACVLVARGSDPGDLPDFEVERNGWVAETDGWRMLMQLTRKDGRTWPTGIEGDRLYFWIRDEDLAAESFRNVVLQSG